MTMKRFLQSVFAILKKTNEPKSAAAHKATIRDPVARSAQSGQGRHHLHLHEYLSAALKEARNP
jgi:hypothetical protein